LNEAHFDKSKLELHAFEEGKSLAGHELVFYTVSPTILTVNTNKRLTSYVRTTPSLNQAWGYL
jgi:hypothetical protein